MASNITVDTLTKGSTTLNTDEIVDTNSSQVCKAWVNFNGTGTVAIRDSHNVSSITDDGVGKYRVFFSTSMSNSNYAVSTSAHFWASVTVGNDDTNNMRDAGCTNLSTSGFVMGVGYTTGAGQDSAYVNATVFGD